MAPREAHGLGAGEVVLTPTQQLRHLSPQALDRLVVDAHAGVGNVDDGARVGVHLFSLSMRGLSAARKYCVQKEERLQVGPVTGTPAATVDVLLPESDMRALKRVSKEV